jgi:lactate dehydrogenase-like 2-hydroxyacid dehydrogenase
MAGADRFAAGGENMSSKPPILSLIRNLHPLMDQSLAAYDVRSEPGPGIRAVVTSSFEGIDAAMMNRLPDLELIAQVGVGYDAVDLAHARSRGISLTNTPDVLTDDVADLAIALMLAVFRKIPQYDAYARSGAWAAKGYPPLTRKLSGSRIGILGLGRIGHAIARRAAPFAGEIAYYSRHPIDDVAYRYAAGPVSLARSVDVLVVATAGGKETAKLVDAEVIEALGPSGVLINIARGSVIDEDAMVAALLDGRLRGAGLDVFADEPHIPEALFGCENVVLLPHQGSATEETRAAMNQLALDNLTAFFAGKPLITPVV